MSLPGQGPCFPGGSANPLNYPADGGYTLGNGLGYSTSKAALGFPAGGLGPDNRVLLYLGDSWKIKSNFTLTYGLRYERDTGRTDSQYAAIPQLSALLPGLGNAVNQPNKNFGPDLGFAWDPMKNGKTSIRGGIGLFWENAIWNNVLFDGPYREPTGAFAQFPGPCAAAGRTVSFANLDRYHHTRRQRRLRYRVRRIPINWERRAGGHRSFKGISGSFTPERAGAESRLCRTVPHGLLRTVSELLSSSPAPTCSILTTNRRARW